MTDSIRVLIPLTNGGSTYVSLDDAPWVSLRKWRRWKPHNRKTSYVVEQGGQNYLHRDILGLSDSSIQADHKDGDGLNNVRPNLRSASNANNNANKAKQTGLFTSTYKGVHWNAADSRWTAELTSNGKHYFLGDFDNEDDAARAYNHAAIRYHGEFAKLNYLPDPLGELPPAQVKYRGKCSSKYRGVSREGKKWVANIWQDGTQIRLGLFGNELEAAQAYNAIAKELHGDKARLNDV